tara:strand:+ start:23963 stop:24835 length:873 start_codon:yes stop_codon:yes gene_type:complete
MTDFIAAPLDLSRLSKPTLVDPSYEPLLAERLASLKARFEAADIPWDVDNLEFDPAVIQQQEDAYRQMLDLQSINDMALARTLGFATSVDLDWIAATFYADVPNIARMAGEKDDRYTRRILVASEALSGALTEGGIIYHALSFDPRIVDAAAFRVGPGVVQCVILVDDDAPAELMRSAVYSHLRNPKLRGTEALTVSLAKVKQREIRLRLQHGSAAIGSTIRADAEAALLAIKTRVERSIGAGLTTDELIATARVGGVVKLFLDEPLTDLDPGRNGVLSLDITVTTERQP